MKHRHGHGHRPGGMTVRENPSWQWSMGLQANKLQAQHWTFGGAEITVHRHRSHHQHHAKRHSPHKNTFGAGFSMTTAGGPQFPPVKPHQLHRAGAHRGTAHGRPHVGPVVEHHKRITEQNRKQAEAHRRMIEDANRRTIAATTQRIHRPSGGHKPKHAGAIKPPHASTAQTHKNVLQHLKPAYTKFNTSRPSTRVPAPVRPAPAIKPRLTVKNPFLRSTPVLRLPTSPQVLGRRPSRFPEAKLKPLGDLGLSEEQQTLIEQQVAGKEGPSITEVPEKIAGYTTGRTLQFLAWSDQGNVLVMSPRDVPIGHSRRGDWWIYSDGLEIQVARRYAEDPETVRRQMERSGQRNPSERDVQRRVDAGKELNRDIEAFLQSGKSLEQSLQQTTKVHEELLQMLGIAFFHAIADKADIDANAPTIMEAGSMIGRKLSKLFSPKPKFEVKAPPSRPLRGGLEAKIPAEAGRVAEKVYSQLLSSPQNPGAKNGGRFATPYKSFVEPDFIPAVDEKGKTVFGKEPTFARLHNEPSIKDALLVADSKYRGFFEGSPPVITFSLLGKKGSEQVMGMIHLAQFTKGRTFVLLGRSGQLIGADIRQFAKALNVNVELYGHPLVK